MRTRAWAAAVVGVVALGCGSSEKSDPPRAEKPAEPARKAQAAPAPAAAPSAEAPSAAIVIKGKKADESASPPRAERDDAAEEARQARIAELKRKASADNVTADWKDFAGPDRSFRILFPSAPQTKDISFQSAGRPFTSHNFFAAGTKGDERFFSLELVDMPAEMNADVTERVYASLAQTAAARMHGRVLESRAIAINGHAGRDTRFEAGNGKVAGRSRTCVVGKRLFNVFAFAPSAEIDARDVSRFLDSFEVLAEK